MAEAETPQEEAPKKKKGKLPMMAIIIGGITIVEAVAFFALTKVMAPSPEAAHGIEAGDSLSVGDNPAPEQTVEVNLLDKFKVPNDKRGKLYIYDFDIAVKVAERDKERMTKMVAERKGEISDRIAAIVRNADFQVLREADLKVLRMHVQHAIGEVAEDMDLVLEVLIPRCVPIPSG